MKHDLVVREEEKPRLLDLCCYAGGATRGYQRAGFHVTGVDLVATPNYCGDEFVQADALTFPLDGFDAIHASPPCHAYVQWQNLNAERCGSRVEHPELIEPMRAHLATFDGPTVLENVPGAPVRCDVMLCGSMFGLGVRRHRQFEINGPLVMRPRCLHTREEIAVYGKLDGRRIWTRTDGTEVRAARTLEQASEAMGIDWMTWDELRESIPPAYTQFIGEQLLNALVAS